MRMRRARRTQATTIHPVHHEHCRLQCKASLLTRHHCSGANAIRKMAAYRAVSPMRAVAHRQKRCRCSPTLPTTRLSMETELDGRLLALRQTVALALALSTRSNPQATELALDILSDLRSN